MRLSEAIRLGSMLKPQAFDYYAFDGGTCALGAAAEACSIDARTVGQVDIARLSEQHEWSLEKFYEVPCPVCDVNHGDCDDENVIAHLNDVHRWTRERIADWVETVENKQAATAVTVQQSVTVSA